MNLYAMPAVITGFFSLVLGFYVLYKNSKNVQNRVFVFFIACVILFSLGEAMLRVSTGSQEALFWGRIAYLGVILLHIASLHFSFVFPSDTTKSIRNKYILSFFYIIAIFFLLLFNLIVSVQDVQISNWGYRIALSSKFYFLGIWFLCVITLVIYNLFKKYTKSEKIIEKFQLRHVFYGGVFPSILAIGTNIIPPIFGVVVFPLGTIGLLILSLFIAASILKYNLFTFKPMIQPSLEDKKSSPKKYKLRQGNPYLVKDIHEKKGYRIFSDQITHGISGLGVTKYFPQKIRNKFKIKTTPLLWFTFNKSDRENIIDPKRIEIDLIPQIEDFMKKSDRSIFYLDCFDQITLVRGFDTSLKFVRDIKKICEDNDSIFLVSMNPQFLDKENLEFLEKEFLEVK